MKKKDTIIVAGLVNAALLSLLMIFALDVNEQEPKIAYVPERPKPVVKEEVVTPPPIPVAVTKVLDEGDQLLEQEKVVEPIVKAEPLPEWYVVKNGDNPWKIAKAHSISTNELLALNKLNEEKAKNLRPGDKIRIR